MKRAHTDTTWIDTYGNVWGYRASDDPVTDLPSLPETSDENSVAIDEVIDEDGNLWQFVSVSETECVIEHMVPACASISIPASLNGSTVIALGEEACMLQSAIEEVFFPSSIRAIGRKAFAYAKNLKTVHFSEGLEIIEGYAFMNAGVKDLHVPLTLRCLEEKAFYRCFELDAISLNPGLEVIQNEVFALTAISELMIPPSVRELGTRVLESHKEQPCAAIYVDPNNPRFHSDEEGIGLYKITPDGLVLYDYRGMVAIYTVLPGTVRIASSTFANNPVLEEVVLPEGLVSIGGSAFRSCRNLKRIVLPDSLVEIGPWAFFNTEIRHLRLPAGFKKADDASLVVRCASGSDTAQEPFVLEIDPNNEHFYLSSGVLCERIHEGYDRAIVYTGAARTVYLPSTIKELGRNLFYRVSTIDELFMHDSIPTFDLLSFSTARTIGHIHFDLLKPYEGRNEIDLYFDQDENARMHFQNFIVAFQANPHDMRTLIRMSDQAIYAMRNTYARGQLALERLSDPYLLDPRSANMLKGIIQTNWRDICRRFAERYYTKGLTQMVNLGFISRDIFDEAIEIVRETGNVGAAGHLLELKHELFGGTVFSEYDL